MKYLPIIDAIMLITAVFLGRSMAAKETVAIIIASIVIIVALLNAAQIRQRHMSRPITKEDLKKLETELDELQQAVKEHGDIALKIAEIRQRLATSG